MEKISYAKTVYGQEEIDAVVKCLNESTQMGKYSREFEAKIANLFNKKSCLYVNSGSSALYIGIEALNLPKGGEVITPALTFGTTVGCLVKNNLVPVFVDVEQLTYCIDANKIEEMISDKTVAILAPNLMGNICDWKKIKKIADSNNLLVIEDSADTLGAKINETSSGSFSDMSITSFYGSHIINCAGNGGALMLNNEKAIAKAKLLRSWGRSSSLFDEKSEALENRFNIDIGGIDYDAKFVFETIGYNLEGNEVGAAFGLVQLKNLERNIQIRENNFKKQNDFFKNHDKLFLTPKQLEGSKTGWLAYPILISKEAKFSRKEFQIYLEKRNIQTRVVFTGNVIRQPMMKNVKYKEDKSGYLNSDAVMERGVLLPLHHGMTDQMFVRLHDTINEFIKNHC
jgi:CDP-6-deoxy-D-xylo-4-hexulose-3-dehydrase